MAEERKNVIDDAVDQVIESRRVRQGISFLIKWSIIGAVTLFVLLIIGVAAGVIK